MHPELEKKLNNYQYLCHTTTVEFAREILRAGFTEEIYATVDRSNQYHAVKIYFIINEDDIVEDDCLIGNQRNEQEWEAHDQVFLPLVDFCDNAQLLRIETDDSECIELFQKLQNFLQIKSGKQQ